MRILLTDWLREWRGHPPEIRPEFLDLSKHSHAWCLVLIAGNAPHDEHCVEVDSTGALAAVRGVLMGTGRAKQIDDSAATRARRLYRPGYDIYQQGDDIFWFVNPVPRPGLFESGGLAGYPAEFPVPSRPMGS
jgi:hypothetical protein